MLLYAVEVNITQQAQDSSNLSTDCAKTATNGNWKRDRKTKKNAGTKTQQMERRQAKKPLTKRETRIKTKPIQPNK